MARLQSALFRDSIHAKLGAFGAGLVLLVALALSIVAYFVCRGIVRKEIDTRLRVIVSSKQNLLLRHISHQRDRMALIASQPRLREVLDQFQRGEIPSERFQRETRQILRGAAHSVQGFRALGLVDLQGRTLSASEDSGLEHRFADEPGIRERRWNFGLPRRSGHGFESVLTFPVINEQDVPEAMLVAIFDLDPASHELSDGHGLGQTGEVLVAAPVAGQIRLIFPTRFNPSLTGAPGWRSPALEGASSGQRGSLRMLDYRGHAVLAAYCPLGYSDWGVEAKIDVDEVYTPLGNLRHSMIALALAALTIGICTSYWLARRFTRPIQEMAATAGAVAAGDRKARVPVRSKDELGQLARAFNAMASELATSCESLEERVRHRTRELADSNRELERFAYVASHDLQEPLRMVTSYTQLLRHRSSEKLGSDERAYINFANDGAKRMRELIEDLLRYSRLGMAKRTLLPCDLEEIVSTALKNLEVAISEKTASVTHNKLPVVQGDPTQLVQLFQNLVGNALKFTPRDPRIHISAHRENEEWQIAIQDNGIGIDPNFFEKIFDLFQRLHTRAEYPGTGIGLAICKRIVETHGGRIWLESTPAGGSTFYFTLPL